MRLRSVANLGLDGVRSNPLYYFAGRRVEEVKGGSCLNVYVQ